MGLLVVSTGIAAPIQMLDLKPFVGQSPFDWIGAGWLVPRGHQVIGGTPFQVDGIVLMYGNYSAQKNRPGKTNINDITVGSAFECLYLLTTVQSRTADGTPLAAIHFHYADGSSSSVEISYGVQVRNWFGPWHKADEPLADSNSREVWRALFSAAATTDDYLRMFHVTFTNPFPTKEVRTISLESLKAPSGLMVAAMSVGPRKAELLPDTVSAMKNPFPDLRPRSGERIRGGGVVKSSDGKPLAGAHVRVTGTRRFTENYFQTTDSDEAMGAEAVTDIAGQFTLPPLPDDRAYNLLAFANGHATAPFGGADMKSDGVEFRLKPQGEEPKFFVRAQVLGPGGRPLPWATVEPDGVNTGGGTSWGGSSGFPEQTITRTNGEFVLGRKQPFSRLQVRVKSPGLASTLQWLDATNATQTIQMGVGAVVRGRVMKAGAPLAGVGVGLSGAERSSEVFAGHFETKTDTNGVFKFEHLPADTTWSFYGIMSSLKAYGALAPRPVSTAAHGETLDLGDREVSPGLKIVGKVKTRHSEPLPNGLKVRASHDTAWDSQSVPVDADGHFELTGLFKGQVEIGIEHRDWHLSGANRSMDLWNPWRLFGMIEEDKDDLILMIEKGAQQYNSGASANGQLPSQDWPQNHPLAGAEKSGPVPITLAGHAIDDKTGAPVLVCKVTPGYKPPVSAMPPPAKPMLKQFLEPFARKTVAWNERPFWQFARTETVSNGNFSVDFQRLTSTPLLRVESDGYEPSEIEAPAVYTNNIVVRLKRGAGPAGVVRLPDGKPAAGAMVIFAASQEQFGLTGKQLSSYGRSEWQQTTAKDGSFSFPARAQGLMLFVAHPAGWAEESVERGGSNLKLELKPWAAVTGTLVSSNNSAPMPGVQLHLTVASDWQHGDPHLNLQASTTSDAKGRFNFSSVPPRRLEVQRMVPFSPGGRISGGWTYVLQTWFVAQPGITNDLGKVIYDKPPPPTMLEQLKSRIGL